MRVPRPRQLRRNASPFERHVPGVRYGVLDELAGYAVRRAQIAIYEDLDHVMTPLQLTPPRFSSMVLIEANPGIRQSDLATVIGVGRPAMVAIIDHLQSQGWLRREVHAGDGRANHLVLTRKGLALLARAKVMMLDLDRRWTQGFSEHERRTLITLLDRLGPSPAAKPGEDPA